MLKGLGRSAFGQRPAIGPARPPAETPAPPPDAASLGPRPRADAAPPPGTVRRASAPPAAGRGRAAAKEANPADEAYETLKLHIHMQLVDRLDMNRVSEMDPTTLRSEIRGVVEHLCDTENPLLNRNERQRLVERDPRRDVRLRAARAAPEGRDDHRHHDQRPQDDLRREGGADRAARRSPSATTSTCSRSSTGSSRGSAGGSTRPRRWSTPACRRVALQRDHPAAGARRRRGHDPAVRLEAAQQGRPAPVQGVHARDARRCWKGR